MPQKLGQHFLASPPILERIASAACPQPIERILEIGPGQGALTAKLLNHAGRVIAVEVDAAMVAHLRERFPGEPRLEVVHADVLTTDLTRWGQIPVAGNLPYYITSPIIEKVLRARLPRAVFLIQKEVALRLTASPGSRDYGYLTVHTAFFGHARRLFDVKPGAFRPPPKVDSTVIAIEPHAVPPAVADPEGFLRFLGQCFRQKRKTLRNNLIEMYPKAIVEAWPEAAMRAEQIPLERFLEMFLRLPPQASAAVRISG
ncbi:MAG: ribosomal RNA small subunit methyltransferase A [Acidobacteria bacterium]|nr:ribosomal RNA small subunit methyltransferase A [Acidobacteriota bacterium]